MTKNSFAAEVAFEVLREKETKRKNHAKEAKCKSPAVSYQGNHGLNCQSSMCFSVVYQRKWGPNYFEQESYNFFKEKRRNKEAKLKGYDAFSPKKPLTNKR